MVARARKHDESFIKYRANLISEEIELRFRLSVQYGRDRSGSILAKLSKRLMRAFQKSSTPKLFNKIRTRNKNKQQRIARRLNRRGA